MLHRVAQAREAGLDVTQVCVAELNDEAMIRVYARENATQRHGTATAVVGSVAAAIRYLAKAVLVGDVSKIFDTSAKSPRSLETLQGQLASSKGLGEPTITAFLKGVPGINPGVVKQQLFYLRRKVCPQQDDLRLYRIQACLGVGGGWMGNMTALPPHGPRT